MASTITLYYAYRHDGRVRDPFHADPNCHHLQRAAGDVRPVQVVVPVARDVCGTCGGDVPTPVEETAGDEETAGGDDETTADESPADEN